MPVRREPRFVFLSDGERAGSLAARYGWRLVAANHRPLGRGRVAERTLDECLAGAELVHRRIDEAEHTVLAERGVWWWHLAVAGRPVAVCVHPYLRRVECLRGLGQFLEAARTASPGEGVVRHFGPHSLRGYLDEADQGGTELATEPTTPSEAAS